MAGLVVPVNGGVVVWQTMQSPVAGCVGDFAKPLARVTMVTPKKVLPDSWQVAHVVAVTPAWFIDVPEKVVKLKAEWQLSHATPVVGMCFAGGALGTKFVAKLKPGP